MTQNQIQYWKNEWERAETIRHNSAMEQIQAETVRVNERSVAENERHNLVVEAENKRHNLEAELLSGYQAQASLASAAAAQTSAAAAYKQATVREAELEQQKWVDTQVQSRQDMLAQASVLETQANTRLKDEQANLTTMQSLTEAKRSDLISAETAQTLAETTLTEAKTNTEHARTAHEWVDTARDTVGIVKDFTSLLTLPMIS